MLKLPTILVLTVFALSSQCAPFGARQLTREQEAILEERISTLAILKYSDRDPDTITAEMVIDATNDAYANEIAELEKEKHMTVDDLPIDLTPFRLEMEENLRQQGMDEAVVKKSFKIVEMLFLKFHDKDIKNLSGDDYFEAVKGAYDKEIQRLQNLK